MTYRDYDDELESSTNTWMLWGLVLMVVFIIAFLAYLLYEPTGRANALESHDEHLVEMGAEFYGMHCVACHGANGEGGIGPALNSQQFLGSAEDSQIKALITVGIPGSQMAAYSIDYGGPLTAEEIDAITKYIRHWEEEAPDNPDWRACCP